MDSRQRHIVARKVRQWLFSQFHNYVGGLPVVKWPERANSVQEICPVYRLRGSLSCLLVNGSRTAFFDIFHKAGESPALLPVAGVMVPVR
jgi:hypothetical protein